MKYKKSIQTKIAVILREIGSKKCIEKAKTFESISHQNSSFNLRSLGLSPPDITSIADVLKQENDNNNDWIKSISFSYNHLIGDLGAIKIAKNLPKSVVEIGLVNCGINDAGGTELLIRIKELPNLRMICVEQNNFSNKLRKAFQKFSSNNSQILVVV